MTDGLDRFAELKRLAAETCGAATDDARIELMAAARLAFERQVEALAAGQRIDYTAFTKTVEMLDKYAPPPPLPEVTLTIVKSKDATPDGSGISGLKACRRCGWSPPEGDWVARCYRCGLKPGGDSVNAPWQPLDISGAPSPGQQAGEVMPDVRTPLAEPVANVVQLPSPPPRRDPGSIHDAVLPDGTPARVRRNNYSSPLEEEPGWDAKHPLPETFWPVG